MDFIGVETFVAEGSFEGQATKVLEGANELFAEIHSKRTFDREAIICEAVDTITAVANILEYMNVDQDTVYAAVADCNARNAERGRLGFAIKTEGGFVSNVSFGAKGVLAQVAEDKAYALRFDNRENARLMTDLLFNLGIEADVIPYAAHP